jgi:hypothetical protein
MLQPSNRSNGVSIASLSIGLPHHGFCQLSGNSGGTLLLFMSTILSSS